MTNKERQIINGLSPDSILEATLQLVSEAVAGRDMNKLSSTLLKCWLTVDEKSRQMREIPDIEEIIKEIG